MASINSEQCQRRIEKLYTTWTENPDKWNADAVVVHAGEGDDDASFTKTSTTQLYLFGYEIPNTILVFTLKKLYVLSSAKKIKIIGEAIKGRAEDAVPAVELLVSNKEDANAANFNQIADAIGDSGADGKVRIGCFTNEREQPKGDMCSKWLARLQQIDGSEMNDIAAVFSEMLYIKEEDELKTVRKAALVSTKAMQHSFVKKFEEAVDPKQK